MAVRRSALLCALAVTVFAGAAQADVIYTGSPRNGMLKFKLGSYTPSIDAGLSGTPYQDTFGGASMLLFEMSWDHYVWTKIGAVGGGVTLGYAEKYARGVAADDPNADVNEKVGIRLAPIKATAFYNFDYTAREWGIPLVPYARAGVAWIPFWFFKGGNVEYVNGERQAGSRPGVAGTIGLSFLLDVLEPRLAKDADSGYGINHYYFFAEYNVLQTVGTGINLSGNYWMFGLALEI